MDVLTAAQLGLEWAKNQQSYIDSLKGIRQQEEVLGDFFNRGPAAVRSNTVAFLTGYRDALRKHKLAVELHNKLVESLKVDWDFMLSSYSASFAEIDAVVTVEDVFR